MALEYTLQAIPHDCGLIDAARINPEIGAFLELFGFADVSYEDLRFRAGDPTFAVFVDNVKAIRDANRGIEHRRLNLGRRWDALLYVLSDERLNNGVVNEAAWQNKAVCGGEILGPNVSSTRGVPIRLLSEDETKIIADELEKVDCDRLGERLDLKSMAEAGVYGVAGGGFDITPESLIRDIERLTNLYSGAAQNDEGMLAFCT